MIKRITYLRANPIELAEYRRRSADAISSLQKIIAAPSQITSLKLIDDKYQKIAEAAGLSACGLSWYGYFVPLKVDEYFLLRMSNHNNTNGELYDEHEKEGRPDKRFIIYFDGTKYYRDKPSIFQEAEHHVVNYPSNSLDTNMGVISFCKKLITLFNRGNESFSPLSSSYSIGDYYQNGRIQGIVAMVKNGQVIMLLENKNIKDKAIANRFLLKQTGQYLYAYSRAESLNSSLWRLPSASECQYLCKNWESINAGIQNVGGNIEMIPKEIWGQNCSVHFSDGTINAVSELDFYPIRRVLTNISEQTIKESKIYKNMKNVKRINESQLRAIVAESVKKVLKEGQYAYSHNYMEPLIGKELAQIEDAIDVISAKLTTHKEPNTIGDPVGKLRQDNMGDERIYRRIQKAIKDIKYGAEELRNCLNPDGGEGEGQY